MKHSIIGPAPAIAPLLIKGSLGHYLQGVKLQAQLRAPELGLTRGPSELMFTHFGLSGPLALDLSLEIATRLKQGSLELNLDLLPETPEAELGQLLQARAQEHPKRELGKLLLGVLPRRVLPALCHQIGIDPAQPCSPFPGELRDRLCSALKRFRQLCVGTCDWKDAMATLGGIDTRQVHSGTMESRLHPRLFFAGEILDICGECGGFNLQWAWSSGHLAGLSAAQRLSSA